MCQKSLENDLGIIIDNIQLLKHIFDKFFYIKIAIFRKKIWEICFSQLVHIKSTNYSYTNVSDIRPMSLTFFSMSLTFFQCQWHENSCQWHIKSIRWHDELLFSTNVPINHRKIIYGWKYFWNMIFITKNMFRTKNIFLGEIRHPRISIWKICVND